MARGFQRWLSWVVPGQTSHVREWTGPEATTNGSQTRRARHRSTLHLRHYLSCLSLGTGGPRLSSPTLCTPCIMVCVPTTDLLVVSPSRPGEDPYGPQAHSYASVPPSVGGRAARVYGVRSPCPPVHGLACLLPRRGTSDAELTGYPSDVPTLVLPLLLESSNSPGDREQLSSHTTPRPLRLFLIPHRPTPHHRLFRPTPPSKTTTRPTRLHHH